MHIHTIAATILVCGATAVAAQTGQDRATVQLRNGTTAEGRIEALGDGFLYLRVSLADQRKLSVSDVALIDRKGGASGLPETELREARGEDHLLSLIDGSSEKGRLVGIKGGEGSGDEGPRTYLFRTLDGQEHRYGQDQVARIYLGSYPFNMPPKAGLEAELSQGAVPPGAVHVPAAGDWVSTGVSVRKGDRVSFASTGEVQLSTNPADRARPAGAARFARYAPLPGVAAGALIGRIGPMGIPFGVGDQVSVPMPAAGLLYLAVNDDERTDNAGQFFVVVTPARR